MKQNWKCERPNETRGNKPWAKINPKAQEISSVNKYPEPLRWFCIVTLQHQVLFHSIAFRVSVCRPVTTLGHQVGRRVCWEGPKFLKLCPIFLNYVQHIFPGGTKKILGEASPPPRPRGYGPVCMHKGLSIYQNKYCKITFLALPRPAYLIFNRPVVGKATLFCQK